MATFEMGFGGLTLSNLQTQASSTFVRRCVCEGRCENTSLEKSTPLCVWRVQGFVLGPFRRHCLWYFQTSCQNHMIVQGWCGCVVHWCGCVCTRQRKRQQERARTSQITALEFNSVRKLRSACSENVPHGQLACTRVCKDVSDPSPDRTTSLWGFTPLLACVVCLLERGWHVSELSTVWKSTDENFRSFYFRAKTDFFSQKIPYVAIFCSSGWLVGCLWFGNTFRDACHPKW